MKNGFKVIDADLHVTEPLDLWETRLPEPYRSTTKIRAPGGAEQHSNYYFQVGDLSFSPRSDLIVSQATRRFGGDHRSDHLARFNRNPTPQLLLEGMAAEGMDVAAIVPTLTFLLTTVDNLPGPHALAICKAFNNWCAEFVAADRQRFRYWAWVPRQDANLAAEEARRCVTELGADGVAMTTGAVDGRLLSDPFFEPLWCELDRLNVPLGLHVWGRSELLRDDVRSRYWGQPNGECAIVMGGAYHGMTSLVELIFSGALERHKNLRPVIMEAGNGWLLHLLDRMDDKWELYGPEFRAKGMALSLRPSDYFRRQCFVTCEGDEHALKYLIDYGLGDNIVFSTDYPHHDSPWPHAVDHLLAQDISDEAKRKILWDNTSRVFEWKDAPLAAV